MRICADLNGCPSRSSLTGSNQPPPAVDMVHLLCRHPGSRLVIGRDGHTVLPAFGEHPHRDKRTVSPKFTGVWMKTFGTTAYVATFSCWVNFAPWSSTARLTSTVQSSCHVQPGGQSNSVGLRLFSPFCVIIKSNRYAFLFPTQRKTLKIYLLLMHKKNWCVILFIRDKMF